jgi:hypothetical protein
MNIKQIGLNMNIFKIIIVITGVFLLAGFAGTSPGLLAPVYPESVASPLRSDKTQSVYLSKEPVKKILSFYDSKVGKLSSKDPLTKSYYLENLGNTPVVTYGKTMMTANQISRQEGYPDPDAKDIGVLLLAKSSSGQGSESSASSTTNISSANTSSIDSMQAMMAKMQKKLMQAMGKQNYSKSDEQIGEMSDLFEGLKNEVYMQRHSKKEMLAVYNKYKFLDDSFYLLVKDKDGSTIPYSKQLLAQYKNKLSSMDMMNDQWNYWMGFLKKLANHAYKTCIVINTKPSTWHK